LLNFHEKYFVSQECIKAPTFVPCYNKILLKGFLRFLQKTYPKRFNEAGDICPPPIAEIGIRHLKKWGTPPRYKKDRAARLQCSRAALSLCRNINFSII